MLTTITWNRKSISQFDDAIAYIEADSISNAEKFKLDILNKIDGLIKNPEKYSPDRYKTGNDGSYRAFELHSYRIAYRYTRNEVRIIRVRHVKMNPVIYWDFSLWF